MVENMISNVYNDNTVSLSIYQYIYLAANNLNEIMYI